MQRPRLLSWSLIGFLCLFVFACSTSKPVPPAPPALPPPPSPPPRPAWSGEKAQVAIVEFDDKVETQLQGSGKAKGARMRNLLGRGMEEQLVTALRQTGQFVILEPQVKNVQNKRGESRTVRVGNLEGAEFLIYGTVTTYQLSQESTGAGVSADPLLGIFSSNTGNLTANSAERTFTALTSAEQDRVGMAIHLIDVKTGKIINETQVEGLPQDFSPSLDGLFGPELFTASSPMQTPMQKAVRVSVIKAVNWIADNCLEYRKQLALNPSPAESPKPLAKKGAKQKTAK